MLGKRFECKILRDEWLDIVDIESGQGFEEVFDSLQLGSVGVEVVHSHSGRLEFMVVEWQRAWVGASECSGGVTYKRTQAMQEPNYSISMCVKDPETRDLFVETRVLLLYG